MPNASAWPPARINGSLTQISKLPSLISRFAKVRPDRRRYEKASFRHDQLAGQALTHSQIHRAGFVYPEGLVRNERLRSAALTRLIALTIVIASLAVLATTLSFGMAQARHCPASAVISSPR